MSVHAGGVALESIDDDGTISVRFTGMCAGCQYRPVTMIATIEPALMAVPGVTAVDVRGARVSKEAAVRLRNALQADGQQWLQPPAVTSRR
jgi:Fe-S cluster biogenesis protein NfuA